MYTKQNTIIEKACKCTYACVLTFLSSPLYLGHNISYFKKNFTFSSHTKNKFMADIILSLDCLCHLSILLNFTHCFLTTVAKIHFQICKCQSQQRRFRAILRPKKGQYWDFVFLISSSFSIIPWFYCLIYHTYSY